MCTITIDQLPTCIYGVINTSARDCRRVIFSAAREREIQKMRDKERVSVGFSGRC